MVTLRKNQIEPVRIGIEYFSEKKPVPSIIVAPTAFGKSIVIAHIAKGVGEKLLVIQPSSMINNAHACALRVMRLFYVKKIQ